MSADWDLEEALRQARIREAHVIGDRSDSARGGAYAAFDRALEIVEQWLRGGPRPTYTTPS